MLTPSEIKSHGIVGAGGAGFPTYVKSSGKVGTFLVNAAECEPLLHKDKEIIKAYPQVVLKGIKNAMELLEANRGIIALKAKYREYAEYLKPLPPEVSFHFMDDFYPAGDEFVMVYETTGRIIPPGGIPLQVDVMVKNLETVYNLGKETPVISKFLTVAGDLPHPVSFEVPVGISLREVLYGAGVENPEKYFILSGGVMMGTPIRDLSQPVTKTLGGLILLDPEHPLARRYQRTLKAQNRIGKSSCDQCCFCTELCPRYLLGHPVMPHLAMRNLQFQESEQALSYARYCCECNLCSLVSCPEDLDPKAVCAQNKRIKAEAPKSKPEITPHPLQKERRTPLSRLFRKLHLNDFKNKAPLEPFPLEAEKVVIPLKQHIGVEAQPLIKVGERVTPGMKIAQIPADQLGADLHASIAGVVTQVGKEIIIEKR